MSLELWTHERGLERARKNAIIGVYGKTKTGKSELATRATGPLYIAHLDPQDNLDQHLLAREAAGFQGPVYEPLRIKPIKYPLLTEDEAKRRVQLVEQFARDALAQAELDDKAGKYPGVFVLDGGRRFKGYIEKMMLGESATLGFRAARGGSGPSTIEYAASNSYLGDFINSFSGTPLHFVITFEGKDHWGQYFEDGKRVRRPSGKVETSMPQGVAWGMNAQVEAFVEREDIVVNNQVVGAKYVHKLRFDWVGFPGMGYLRERTMPAMSFDQLLDLLQSKIPAEQVLEEQHEIKRVDMGDPMDEAEAE